MDKTRTLLYKTEDSHICRRQSETKVNVLKPAIRMEQDLGVTVDSSIKLVVSLDRVVDTNFVADNKARLRPTSYDQIAKVAVVSLDIALAGTEEQTLDKSVSKNHRVRIVTIYLFEQLPE